jgi:hypothetical protein
MAARVVVARPGRVQEWLPVLVAPFEALTLLAPMSRSNQLRA